MKKWLETDSFEEAFGKFNDNMEEIEQNLTEPLILENLIVNGDFSEGVVGWIPSKNLDTSVIDNEITMTMNERSSSQQLAQFINGFNQGDISYISFDMNRSIAGMETIWNGVLKINWNYPTTNVWKKQSSILQPFDSAKNTVLGLYIKTQFAEVGEYLKLRNVLMINLTQTFGAGNEPTKEEMDEIINIIGWFDNEYALSNKEMFIVLLNMVRKNTMSIIALGGTQ